MKRFILFILIVLALYGYYLQCGHRSVSPQIIAESIVKVKANSFEADSFYVEINHKTYSLDHVLSAGGSWVYPQKDSVVTAFITAKDPVLRCMSGKVDATEIDQAFQNQTVCYLGVIGFALFMILFCRDSDDLNIEQPDTKNPVSK